MKMLDRKSGGVFKLWNIPRTPWIQDYHVNPKTQKIEGTNIETFTADHPTNSCKKHDKSYC
jgi:hypothetical protein